MNTERHQRLARHRQWRGLLFKGDLCKGHLVWL